MEDEQPRRREVILLWSTKFYVFYLFFDNFNNILPCIGNGTTVFDEDTEDDDSFEDHEEHDRDYDGMFNF